MSTVTRAGLLGALLGSFFALAITSAAQAVPYQRYQNASCPAGPVVCNIDFPVVAAGKRLLINNVSCYLRTSGFADLDLYAMQLLVIQPGGLGSAVTLVPRFIDSIGSPSVGDIVWSASHTISAFANPGGRFRGYTELKAGSIRQFACHISGDLVNLP